MFMAGAVVGYGISLYYAELLWVADTTSDLVAAFIVAPAGALIFGLLSAFFARSVAIFATATVIGYFVVLFCWIAYAVVFDIADREGSKGMGMVFIIAPAGGAMIGLIAAGLLSRRTPQTTP
jgi:hypothetical protein